MNPERVRPLTVARSRTPPDILLINTPASFEQGIIPDDDEPSFGLLRIATAVETIGLMPAYLDAHRHKMGLPEIDDILFDLKPRSVGINPTSVNVSEAQEIAELCANRGIPVIIGGVHSTLDPQKALTIDFPMAKAAVRGRGEYPVMHFLSDICKDAETGHVGLYYNNPSIHSRQDYANCYPLDALPLVDQKKYVHNPLTNKTIESNGSIFNLKEISLFETAGCPFQCTFCATPVLVNRGKGQRSYHRPEMTKIIESTRMAINLGANAIHFLDDMAFVTPKHFQEFATGVNSMNTPKGFHWRGMTRAPIIADKCTDKDMRAIKNSGCWRISLGVESGNDDILRRIKKGGMDVSSRIPGCNGLHL